MNITTELYRSAQKILPAEGQHIVAHQAEDLIVVYQAYKPSIAAFAVKHQFLGGNEFSYNRMSWIKPNFLWMMYRCGWAVKENQERVLALWIQRKDFESILLNAAISSFNPRYHSSYEAWKAELDSKEVRLQWDPDHDPFGNKITRRAIQLGLKGNTLKAFGKDKIERIEDVTDFVKEQKQLVDENQLDKLLVPVERVWQLDDSILKQRIGID